MVGWPWLISGRQLTFEERAAAAVAAASSPEDLILVFNESHSIYFLSRRPSVAKFVFPTHYLEATNFRVLGIEPSRYFESLLQRKPKVLVIGELLNNKSGPRPDYALIDKDYLAKATISEGKRRAEIYERRTDVSDAPDSRLIPR
jgi:hypothetical protein